MTAGGRSLAEAKIQRGIFQGGVLSPLLFIIAMITLNLMLRKYTAGYKLIEKCAMLVMKSGKRQLTDGMELPNQDKIKTLSENEIYKYLGILETDTIKQVEMKEKIQREYLRRTRKLLQTKLNSRNLIKGINTWAVPLVRYSGPFLKWIRNELKQMEQRTRKLMTMHKALHPRDDVDRLYVSRKEGGRGLDWVSKVIHWEMCKKFKFDYTNKWYMHNPAPVLENATHKLLWAFDIHTDHLISTRRAELVIINNIKKRTCKIVDFAVPADHRIKLKECEKKDKYLDLARELKKKKTVEHAGDNYTNCNF